MKYNILIFYSVEIIIIYLIDIIIHAQNCSQTLDWVRLLNNIILSTQQNITTNNLNLAN